MEVPFRKNVRFVCVDYPGVVADKHKMLATLGGEEDVTKTFCDQNRRLELRWRPLDAYCKPACGDRFPTTNLLMRVKKKKRKSPSHNDSTTAHAKEEETKYESEFIGLIDTTFKFQGLADFQYLPMMQQAQGGYASLRDKLMIERIVEMDWMKEKTDLFLPPQIFSRIDTAGDYAYRGPQKHKEGYADPTQARASNLIGVARQRRPHFTVFRKFEDPEIPTGPVPEAVEKLRPKIKDDDKETELAELFKRRPVWSKNAIKCNIDVHPEKLKFMLPLVAYFFVTGPWRTLWVRFGYDPRKEIGAKKYQLVDYRLKQRSGPDHLKITPKRSTFNYCLPNTVSKSGGQVARIQQEDLLKDHTKDPEKQYSEARKSTYIFKPGVLPPYRQMFYQLCDIDEPQIQALLQKNDGQENPVCTERDGWCIDNIQDQCRLILASHITPLMDRDVYTDRKGKSSLKHPAKSSKSKIPDKKVAEPISDLESESENTQSDTELSESMDCNE